MQIILKCKSIVLLMASQWIMQDNCLNKTHSCFQWSNQNISGKFACSVFLIFRKNEWFMNSRYHPIFSQQLCSHGIIQEFRICGSERIQPWCSAGRGRSSFPWEGGKEEGLTCGIDRGKEQLSRSVPWKSRPVGIGSLGRFWEVVSLPWKGRSAAARLKKGGG